MDEAIQSAIADIERELGVRVLYAAESGSRAWGFASPDSDYDVRFIYTHPRDWYLSVFEQRDVIERMLPGDLDVSGWDLRKSLRLLSKCNLAFNEWFDSPIVYRADETFAQEVRLLIADFFQPARALFHYLGMARSTYADHLAGDQVRLKKLFYFLRPILACRWIEHHGTQPPTAFAQLLAAPWVSDEERTWIGELEIRKAVAKESEYEPMPGILRTWMLEQSDYFERIGATLARPVQAEHALLDATLRRWATG
ncbi:nucleotidyltransferase domain-containing protein [Dyella silvatica]|uniref:nucleotidyltransferase domain-containing protein n=1 Tax=Dyella silvatica TaxID=2992128 RepID=UPI0022582116|nr:nucleotidyltransferase domain-containing protein [Dyella silvatica]